LADMRGRAEGRRIGSGGYAGQRIAGVDAY